MARNPYGNRRPGGVTFVILLTWLVAFLTMVTGFLTIGGEGTTLLGVRIDPHSSIWVGWADIAFGIVTVLVGVGLASRLSAARLLVTALMILRIAAAVWVGYNAASPAGWLVAAIAGLFALLILLMLWNGQADAWFSR